MVYKRSIIDIFQELSEGFNDEKTGVEILTVTPSGSNQILECDDIKYSQKGYSITLQEGVYEILSIDAENNTITVDGTTPVVPQTFDLYPIVYFHGTEPETGNTLVNEKDFRDKTPMMWLRENFVESFQPSDSVIDRESDVELFFLTSADYNKVIDDRYTEYIDPMSKALQLFWSYIQEKTSLVRMENEGYEVETFTKFGVYAINKGYEQPIFFDKLAGQRMKAKFRFTRKISCG